MFGLEKLPSINEVEGKVRKAMMADEIDPSSSEYKAMAETLEILEKAKGHKGDYSFWSVFKVLAPAIISGAVTIGGLWMMLEYEKEGHIGSKALPFIPKPKF